MTFFGSVFTKDEDDEQPHFSPNIDCSICDIIITVNKVKSLLKQLNSSKSMGPDNFHPRFLKETVDSFAYPITLLFNKFLSEGKLPQDWKSVNITCIFKSGDKTKASNYRPSITSILCRMLENIIKTAVMGHCNDNLVFSDCQYGVRQRRECIVEN